METMGRTQRPRQSFTPEFKVEVVELVRQPANTASSVARDLDLTETAVRDWVRQADVDERKHWCQVVAGVAKHQVTDGPDRPHQLAKGMQQKRRHRFVESKS
jgi:hypothetical protein